MTPLRQRMINDMTVRGLARSTMESYLRSVTRLARHYRRSPDQISAREVQDCLVFLQQHEGLHRGTCNTIRHGVRFFFRITLERPDPHFYVPGAKVPSTLPQILNHDELIRLFTVTTNLKHRAVLMTAYAAGLRASELCRLQLTDIDFARMCLRVDQGKGDKDRYVPLSPRLLELLREYWRHRRPQRMRRATVLTPFPGGDQLIRRRRRGCRRGRGCETLRPASGRARVRRAAIRRRRRRGSSFPRRGDRLRFRRSTRASSLDLPSGRR